MPRNEMLPIILDLVIKIQAKHIPCTFHVYETEFDVTVRDLMGEVIADYCLDDESGTIFDECVEVLTKIIK